ncbi:MAG: cysteine hydrolase [Planctomycetota bacterium]|nr:cysteine hydrolase [Planctomycetota bacterium]
MTDDELIAEKEARIAELHRPEPGRTALLVIDMQRAFVEPGAALEVPEAREIVPNIRRLISCAREVGVPVIFTRYVYSRAVPCLRGDPFGPEHLPPPPGAPTGFGRPSGNALVGPESPQGPDSPAVIEELAPRPDELVVQGYAYDKFYGTPLDHALRSRDIRYLLITGVTADICVNATLMSATTREYRVTAVTDGTATLWPNILEACFDIWRRKFARLRSTDEVIAELEAFGF